MTKHEYEIQAHGVFAERTVWEFSNNSEMLKTLSAIVEDLSNGNNPTGGVDVIERITLHGRNNHSGRMVKIGEVPVIS